MNKEILTIIFIISDILCLLSFGISYKSKSRFRVAISAVMVAGIATTTTYMFTLIFNTYKWMNIAYCFYFCSMDWLCFTICLFMIRYSYQISKKKFDIIRLAIFPFLAIDSISQIANIWTEHSVAFNVTYLENGDMVFNLIPKWPFQIHLCLCYILIGVGIILLLIRTFSSARIYSSKYINIIVSLLLIIMVNAVFVLGNFKIDISILGYSFCAIMIAFNTIIWLPKQLANHMSGRLVTYLNSGYLYLMNLAML